MESISNTFFLKSKLSREFWLQLQDVVPQSGRRVQLVEENRGSGPERVQLANPQSQHQTKCGEGGRDQGSVKSGWSLFVRENKQDFHNLIQCILNDLINIYIERETNAWKSGVQRLL